jgi:hypothetical protein
LMCVCVLCDPFALLRLAGEGGASPSHASTFSRLLQSMGDSDDARWALYHGVKQLAKSAGPEDGGVEAKLFFNFLDEKYGEDELAFFLFW